MSKSIPASQFVVGSLVSVSSDYNPVNLSLPIIEEQIGIIVSVDRHMITRAFSGNGDVPVVTVHLSGCDYWLSVERLTLISTSPYEA